MFTVNAQSYKVHSHNDYEQEVPFWKAFSPGVSMVEANVFLIDGQLMVAHEKEHILQERTLERLYLDPLKESLELGLMSDRTLQVLIDVKSDATTSLDAIVQTLEDYQSITGNEKISFVISGNRPKPAIYINYPDFISLDYQSLEPINDVKVLDKIGLISLNFRSFTDWNGKGRLTKEDLEKGTHVVEKSHSLRKPFRFWATSDSKIAWKAMVD